jgi:hypothetical protein
MDMGQHFIRWRAVNLFMLNEGATAQWERHRNETSVGYRSGRHFH